MNDALVCSLINPAQTSPRAAQIKAATGDLLLTD